MDWLRQIPMGQYVDGSEGWLRRLDPRLKLAWSLVFLLTPVLAGPWWRIGLVLSLFVITALSGLPRKLWWRSLLVLVLLAIAVGSLSMLLPAVDPPAAFSLRNPMELPDASDRRSQLGFDQAWTAAMGQLQSGSACGGSRFSSAGVTHVDLWFSP
jgi:energy-coupling factor transport system permease protein